jgi:hypothetical protein
MPNISADREVFIGVIAPDSSHERTSVRLLEILEHYESPPDPMKDSIIEAVEGFSAGKSHANELTRLSVHYSGITESDRPIASVATAEHVTRGEA